MTCCCAVFLATLKSVSRVDAFKEFEISYNYPTYLTLTCITMLMIILLLNHKKTFCSVTKVKGYSLFTVKLSSTNTICSIGIYVLV